ncbi:hypothetical protein PAAG_03508 [Paracoccidioides lutzii Pb01]|uniref:Uncharacterized protein n=1 Tax=Paracoccidioides lutzii (strain ATCC MYA-826 / Pb01) TaxID=502779 RepID=C1GXD4_PARBA|nr:hypothetical protein PAAG_03508 [Paracoccidioides lutzii Pb01]EEH41222.2 hypothetical protein PAAG_03508 [Paracoccidioides lutzii Pb01]
MSKDPCNPAAHPKKNHEKSFEDLSAEFSFSRSIGQSNSTLATFFRGRKTIKSLLHTHKKATRPEKSISRPRRRTDAIISGQGSHLANIRSSWASDKVLPRYPDEMGAVVAGTSPDLKHCRIDSGFGGTGDSQHGAQRIANVIIDASGVGQIGVHNEKTASACFHGGPPSQIIRPTKVMHKLHISGESPPRPILGKGRESRPLAHDPLAGIPRRDSTTLGSLMGTTATYTTATSRSAMASTTQLAPIAREAMQTSEAAYGLEGCTEVLEGRTTEEYEMQFERSVSEVLDMYSEFPMQPAAPPAQRPVSFQNHTLFSSAQEGVAREGKVGNAEAVHETAGRPTIRRVPVEKPDVMRAKGEGFIVQRAAFSDFITREPGPRLSATAGASEENLAQKQFPLAINAAPGTAFEPTSETPFTEQDFHAQAMEQQAGRLKSEGRRASKEEMAQEKQREKQQKKFERQKAKEEKALRNRRFNGEKKLQKQRIIGEKARQGRQAKDTKDMQKQQGRSNKKKGKTRRKEEKGTQRWGERLNNMEDVQQARNGKGFLGVMRRLTNIMGLQRPKGYGINRVLPHGASIAKPGHP